MMKENDSGGPLSTFILGRNMTDLHPRHTRWRTYSNCRVDQSGTNTATIDAPRSRDPTHTIDQKLTELDPRYYGILVSGSY